VRFDKLIDGRYYYVNVLQFKMPAYDVRNLWITAQIHIYRPDSITVNKEMYMYGLFDSAVQLQGSVPHSFQATKEEVNGDEIIRSDFDTTRGSQNRYRFYVLKEADSSGEDAASAVGGGSSAAPTNGPATVMSENDVIAAWFAARPLLAESAVTQAMGGAGGPSPVGGGSSATAPFNEDPSNATAIASTATPTASTSSAAPSANSEDPTVNSTNVDKSEGSKPPSRKTSRHRRKRNNRRSSRRTLRHRKGC